MNGSYGSDGKQGDGISTLINIVKCDFMFNGGNTFEIGQMIIMEIPSIAEPRTLDIRNGAHGESGFDGTMASRNYGSDGSNGLNFR